VTFIRQAADALAELVGDLLDLAKVEAGKTVVRPVEFDVGHLFGALRGLLRPLLVNESVSLVFDEGETPLVLHTDEAKVSQILRNFISNALKFTERGEVRIAAELSADQRSVVFRVADTGIGIAPDDQERIFQEFTQIESPVQRRVRGTGLGLPLCRKLAELLGGRVSVESAVGLGATFTAEIPILYASQVPEEPEWVLDPSRVPVLVVEDSPETLLIYERLLAGSAFQMLPARTVREAHLALTAFRPRAIVLDIVLRGEETWGFLAELKRRPDTQDVPVLVLSTVDDPDKALALGADAYCVKPIDRQTLLHELLRMVDPQNVKRVLVVDDEEIFRYVLRQHLVTPHHAIFEAANGREALRIAQAEHPDVICLDLMMPEVDGFEVLRQLKGDPGTRDIPVVVITSKALDDGERHALLGAAATILPKDRVSREEAVAAVDEALRLAGGS
jgi:CheY-like chemotaxis protein/two-component sensor histidine kinase